MLLATRHAPYLRHLLEVVLHPAHLLGWQVELEQPTPQRLLVRAHHSGSPSLLFDSEDCGKLTSWQQVERWLDDCNYTLCARVSRSTARGLL